MIGMMVLTFLLFFAFVVNVGMLVHAKINLQNAADLAAYAGSIRNSSSDITSSETWPRIASLAPAITRTCLSGRPAQAHPVMEFPQSA
jgi:Flp pilus assembly protein TadG